MKRLILSLTIITGCFLNQSTAQVTGLDMNFGIAGRVITPIGSGTVDDYGHATVIQPDGKILVAGYSVIGTTYDFSVVRYNVDGSLDNTFDSDGKVTTDVSSYNDEGHAIALQPDGKILVAGSAYNGSTYDIGVVRYNTNGSLDNTFSGDGKVMTSLDAYEDDAFGVLVQSDGKIVVTGLAYTVNYYDVGLIRYNSDGTLDNTFSGDGKVIVTISSSSFEVAAASALQSDGKIVIGGYTDTGGNSNFMLMRFNTNGTLDNTFDGDGRVTTAVGSSNESIYGLSIQSDGKIVAAGYSQNGSKSDFAIVRYNTDGSLDNTFDSDGKVTTAIGTNNESANAVAIQTNGKIVIVGNSIKGFNNLFAILRYNADGSLDNTFNGTGKGLIEFGTGGASYDNYAKSVAVQSDGQIIVAGYTIHGGADFAVVRCEANPILSVFSGNDSFFALKMYPNPAKNILHFNIEGEALIAITDLSGHLIKETVINHSVLSIDGLNSGVYLVSISQNGQKTIEKLTVE